MVKPRFKIETTTVTPLNLALAATTFPSRVAWWLVTIAAVGALIASVTLQVIKYTDGDTNVVTKLTSNRLPFPAVTFCNLNPYKRSAAKMIPALSNLLGQFNNISKPSSKRSTTPGENGSGKKRRKRATAGGKCCVRGNLITAGSGTSVFTRCDNGVLWSDAWDCCANNAPLHLNYASSRLARVDNAVLIDALIASQIISSHDAFIGLNGPTTKSPADYFWYNNYTSQSSSKVNVTSLCPTCKPSDATWTDGGLAVIQYDGANTIFNNYGEQTSYPYICEYVDAVSTNATTTVSTTTTDSTTASATSASTLATSTSGITTSATAAGASVKASSASTSTLGVKTSSATEAGTSAEVGSSSTSTAVVTPSTAGITLSSPLATTSSKVTIAITSAPNILSKSSAESASTLQGASATATKSATPTPAAILTPATTLSEITTSVPVATVETTPFVSTTSTPPTSTSESKTLLITSLVPSSSSKSTIPIKMSSVISTQFPASLKNAMTTPDIFVSSLFPKSATSEQPLLTSPLGNNPSSSASSSPTNVEIPSAIISSKPTVQPSITAPSNGRNPAEIAAPSAAVIDEINNALNEVKNSPTALSATVEDMMPYLLASLPPELAIAARYSAEELVMRCVYNGVKCSAKNFRLKLDPNYGNCYTFNADGDRMVAAGAGASRGLSVTYLVGENEYMDHVDLAGVRIVVHKQNETVFPDNIGFNAASGFQASASLARIHSNSLSSSSSPCVDCPSQVDTFNYNSSYSSDACMRSCYQKSVIKLCDCGDPRVPLPLPANAKVGYCNILKRDCVNDYYDDVTPEDACNCPPACQTDIFDVQSLTLLKWSRNQDAFLRSKSNDSEDKSYRSSSQLVKIDIYYSELTIIEYNETQAYSLWDLMWDMSGVIGLFLGISAMSLFEIVQAKDCLRKN